MTVKALLSDNGVWVCPSTYYELWAADRLEILERKKATGYLRVRLRPRQLKEAKPVAPVKRKVKRKVKKRP